MSEHHALIEWTLHGASFSRLQYSREHTWRFDGGAVVTASSSPSVVPLPWSNPAAVDPEEAFVASIASCHMLWWLSLAALAKWEVARYRDAAVGRMERDEQGRWWISRVALHPEIDYAGAAPSPAQAAHLHHQAHERCFIAHSVRTEIVVEPVAPIPPSTT